jgi:hypothetical protein
MPDPSSLSILIPIYNHDVRQLTEMLLEQAEQLNMPFEILCFDDGSTSFFKNINKEIGKRKNTTYLELPQNIGRSRIRNRLALASKFNHLLFLDCDSGIVKNDFLKNYLAHCGEEKVVVGGTIYKDKAPKEFSLRWKFGKAREERSAKIRSLSPFQSITINNLLIDRITYLKHKLDENIIIYGHEDTKFGYALKKSNVSIEHIDNPVEHCGLETNQAFLDKTKEGIKNFYKLINEGYGRDTKLYKSYKRVSISPFKQIFFIFYNLRRSSIHKDLLSEHPSLFNFDLFKLMLLLEEAEKGKRE